MVILCIWQVSKFLLLILSFFCFSVLIVCNHVLDMYMFEVCLFHKTGCDST